MARTNQDLNLNRDEVKILKLASKVIRILKTHGCNVEYFKVNGLIKHLIVTNFLSANKSVPVKVQAYFSTIEFMLSRYGWPASCLKNYISLKSLKT